MRGASLADSFQIFPFLMRQDAPDIYTKINEYVPRDLTFDTDILNAFSGLLHQAWSSTHSFLGIPFWCVPVADPVLMDRSFIAALAWRPNTGLRQGVKHMTRRPGFPSWSWTGWRGMTGIKPRPAKCVFQSTSSDQVTNSFGSVQLEDTKGVKISVKDYVDRMNIHWDMSQFSLRLHLTAWYIEVLLRPLPGDEVWDNVLITSDGHNDFARGLVMATVPRDEAFFGIPGLLEKRWPMLYFQDYDGKDYVNWGLILKPTGGGCYEKLGVTTRFEVHPAEAKRRSFRKTDGCECEIGGVSELECELRTIVLI